MLKEMAKLFLVAALLVTISSCDRQTCTNVNCPIGQSCHNGRCYCQDGYEGTDCQTPSYQKYVGLNNYAYENCNAAPPFVTNLVSITWDGISTNQVVINGLMGSNCNGIVAYIRTDTNNEGNILEINQQYCGGASVYGQGIYDKANRRVNFQLYYSFGGNNYQCSTTVQ